MCIPLVELRESSVPLNWQHCRSVLSECWVCLESNVKDPRVVCGGERYSAQLPRSTDLGWTLFYICTPLKLGVS